MSTLVKGKNDLKTVNPTLAKEWHPTKNGSLTPFDVAVGSHKKVWWLGKCGHEWLADIHNRAKGIGCPICSGKVIVPGVNDLKSKYPELAKEWHPTKNGLLTPDNVAPHSSKKVWWINSDGIEWEDTIAHRVEGRNCPNKPGKKPIIGKNDLGTLFPHLFNEWHPTKNGSISFYDINSGSETKYWWICPKGHEYLSSPEHRARGRGCPICNRERATSLPEQIVFYYINKIFGAINRFKMDKVEIDIFIPSKNIGIEYDGERYHSSEKAKKKEFDKDNLLLEKGICLYRIKESKKATSTYIDNNKIFYNPKNDYSLIKEALLLLIKNIDSSIKIDIDIPRDLSDIYATYLSVDKNNSIAVKCPSLLSEWDYEKNKNLNPEHFSYSSSKKVWWRCKYNHSWQASIGHRSEGEGCPVCSGRIVEKGFNDLATINPLLAKEWHPTKNRIAPNEVTSNCSKKVWWLCPKGHEWQAVVISRNRGAGCPICGRISAANKLKRRVLNCETNQIFESAHEAAKSVGSKYPTNISSCCLGKIKSYKGYHWKYID